MNSRRVRETIKKGIDNSKDCIGEGISAMVNVALHDPTGMSGVVAKTAFGKGVQVLAEKLDPCQLTEWEKERVINCMVSSIDKIKERLEKGDKLRDDGFFKEKANGKTDASEVFESIVIASQREAEEMKQIFYGNMLANIGFVEYLDKEEFLFLVKVFEKLTYRQCLLLAVFAGNTALITNDMNSMLTDSNPIKGTVYPKDVILYQEILDLYQKSLLFTRGAMPYSIRDIIPSDMYAYAMGINIVELAQIDHLIGKKHKDDLQEVMEHLSKKSTKTQ